MSGEEVSVVEVMLTIFAGSFAVVTGLGLGMAVSYLVMLGIVWIRDYGEYMLDELKHRVQKRKNGKIDDYC